jgi:uncharacterized Tic20 family protein
MTTGERIKDLRLKKGFTQEDLAAKTEISVRTIQRIENGEVDPRAYTLQTIASALEVDFESLIEAVESNMQSQNHEVRKWRALLHLSGLFIMIIPPIIVWICKRDKMDILRKDAYDVINFQLSMTIYLLPLAVLSVYPILLILAVFSQVMIIINTMKASNDQHCRYPLTIRFMKAEGINSQPSPVK